MIEGHLGNDLRIDENGVYFVLTSADINQQEFCVNYCAFQGNLTATFRDTTFMRVLVLNLAAPASSQATPVKRCMLLLRKGPSFE